MLAAQLIITSAPQPITRRRPSRSAALPVTTTSSKAGRNCTSPIQPSSAGLRVSSYICQATETETTCAANDVRKREKK